MTTVATKSQPRIQPVSLLSHIKYEHLIAGISGGLTSTLVLHPLDVIKIRFAVNDGRLQTTPKYTGIANAFVTIYKQETVKGLYRGLTPNLFGSGLSWGLYFLFYNSLKNWSQEGNIDKELSACQHLIAASEAGLVTLLFTNPIWVVKTRLCLQYGNYERYNGLIDCLVKIYKTEGFRGYYKGLVPGIFGVSHGAVQFMTYEEMKKYRNYYKNQPLSAKLHTFEYLAFAGSSKLIAVAVTYPYQVVRARLQNQYYSYDSALDCINKTWRYESWRGFYKGLGANLIRVMPATMITFITYENILHTLMKHNLEN